LFVIGGGTTIRGFAINRFGRSPGAAVARASSCRAATNTVEASYIGTDATGTVAQPNNFDGVFIQRLEQPARRHVGGADAT
jgi:hypothetical protein